MAELSVMLYVYCIVGGVRGSVGGGRGGDTPWLLEPGVWRQARFSTNHRAGVVGLVESSIYRKTKWSPSWDCCSSCQLRSRSFTESNCTSLHHVKPGP